MNNVGFFSVSEDFCVSVIVGQDLVPRLSFQSVMLLKENMKKLLRSCKLPKYQIIGSGICSLCIKDWKKRLHQTRDCYQEEPSAGGDNASDQQLMSPACKNLLKLRSYFFFNIDITFDEREWRVYSRRS